MKGREIITAICKAQRVPLAKFFCSGKRTRPISSARRQAVLELKSAGFTLHQIEKMLKIDYAAVKYHLYPTRREAVRRNARRFHEAQRMQEAA
jgi:DNA-binding NarL/FixJ family response regulator